MQIDIVSDVVCPWCYIGRKQLGAALASRAIPSVQVRWRPFLLHPFLGPEGMDRDELMTMKFGRTSGRMFDRVRDAGRRAGIEMRFDRIKRVPDTLNAHCVLDWAKRDGAQDDLALALFAAYFEEGADISDPDVLGALAGRVGMDAASVRRRLADGEDRERIRDEAEGARAEMITGVPYFVVDARYPIPGAQSAETIAAVLDRMVPAPAA